MVFSKLFLQRIIQRYLSFTEKRGQTKEPDDLMTWPSDPVCFLGQKAYIRISSPFPTISLDVFGSFWYMQITRSETQGFCGSLVDHRCFFQQRILWDSNSCRWPEQWWEDITREGQLLRALVWQESFLDIQHGSLGSTSNMGPWSWGFLLELNPLDAEDDASWTLKRAALRCETGAFQVHEVPWNLYIVSRLCIHCIGGTVDMLMSIWYTLILHGYRGGIRYTVYIQT